MPEKSKSISITIDPETEFYLDYLRKKAHVDTMRGANSIIIRQLIHTAVSKYKISDRPVYTERVKTEEGDV